MGIICRRYILAVGFGIFLLGWYSAGASELGIKGFEKEVACFLGAVKADNKFGAWVSGSGKGSVELTSGKPLTIAVSAGKLFNQRFAKHTPVKVDSLPRKLFAGMQVKAGEAGEYKIEFCWIQDDGAIGAPVGSATVMLFADKFTPVLVPLDPQMRGQSFGGYRVTFGRKGDYQVRNVRLFVDSAITLEPLPENAFLSANSLNLKGKYKGPEKSLRYALVDSAGNMVVEAPVRLLTDGSFSLAINKKGHEYKSCHIELTTTSGQQLYSSNEFFLFPELGSTRLPRVVIRDGKAYTGDKPFGFVGINFTGFQLGVSIREHMSWEYLAKAVKTFADWKVRVIRVPLNIGLIQPEPGVFPGNVRWKELYKKHGLKEEFFDCLEYFVQLCADNGIYTVIDIHAYATDPYRYFLGGTPANKGSGVEGKAISYLADTKTQQVPFSLSRKDHLNALVSTMSFLAGHFRGNSNIFCFESPHNEPHDKYMSVPANFSKVTTTVNNAIKAADPQRLCYIMTPAFSHDNVSWPATWLPPYGSDGNAPHFYLANGPVPIRDDAKGKRHPWLCRDVEATFSYATYAVFFPYTSVNYPIYNGEGGEHGYEDLLPGMESTKAASYMVEASFVQYYAAGCHGSLNWTMYQNPKSYNPFVDVYSENFKRFAPVYQSGPLDNEKADIVFIQNNSTAPIANSHNFSCVPLAKMALDLHLTPVKYMTDQQMIFTGLAQYSLGLEQVATPSSEIGEKIIIADESNLDPRVMRVLNLLNRKKGKVLLLKDAQNIDYQQVTKFLDTCGYNYDRKTDASIQVVEGPAYLILYRRFESKTIMAYPLLRVKGVFELIDEMEKVVFRGDAAELHEKGLKVGLPKWRSHIFRISQVGK